MSKLSNPIETFIIRYNFVLLVILAASALGASIYLAYSTFETASDPNSAEIKSDIPKNFDKDTREKINTLHRSDDDNITVSPPAGRINPLSE